MAGLVRMVQVDVGVLAVCGHACVVPGVSRPTGVVLVRVGIQGVGNAVGPIALQAQALDGCVCVCLSSSYEGGYC
jgi:hypothetical protein